ncbi:MAG TPA: response regulator [Holophaga sp.]|nr:response regulator [Holophaga sp.]
MLRLLIVDDSEEDFDLACWSLSREGAQVEARRVDRLGALHASLGEMDWDAVLSDYSLPGLSVEDVVLAVRNSGRALPVILLSGSLREGLADTLQPLGIRHIISKDQLGGLRKALQEAIRDGARKAAR